MTPISGAPRTHMSRIAVANSARGPQGHDAKLMRQPALVDDLAPSAVRVQPDGAVVAVPSIFTGDPPCPAAAPARSAPSIPGIDAALDHQLPPDRQRPRLTGRAAVLVRDGLEIGVVREAEDAPVHLDPGRSPAYRSRSARSHPISACSDAERIAPDPRKGSPDRACRCARSARGGRTRRRNVSQISSITVKSQACWPARSPARASWPGWER